MPSRTLSDLRDRVRRLGDYENATNKITNALLTEFINYGIAELYDLITDTFEGFFLKTGTVTTSNGDQTVALPSDCAFLRALDRDHGDNRFSPLRRINLLQSYRYSGTGEPFAYMLHGDDTTVNSGPGTIRLWPIPDAAYSLRVTYDAIWTALSADGDTFFFHNHWEQFVVYTALVQVCLREERSAAEFQAMADRARERIVGSARKRNSAEPEYLTPRGSVHSDEEWEP